jgi:diguanylate cyclase (GGDEF)-like protein
MGDIDHFKRFNDVHGHAVGDKVIQAVAKALGSKLREGDVLCRYGGEEFCIVLPNATAEQAAAVAERARETVEAHAGESIRSADVGKVTSSFGVATLKLGSATLDALVDRADTALYTSKNNGRNQVTVWQAPEQ